MTDQARPSGSPPHTSHSQSIVIPDRLSSCPSSPLRSNPIRRIRGDPSAGTSRGDPVKGDPAAGPSKPAGAPEVRLSQQVASVEIDDDDDDDDGGCSPGPRTRTVPSHVLSSRGSRGAAVSTPTEPNSAQVTLNLRRTRKLDIFPQTEPSVWGFLSWISRSMAL